MAFDKPKASSTARGYGKAHRELRARLLDHLEQAGSLRCAETCILNRPLFHNDPDGVVLAHTPDRTRYLGLAHATCNRQEATSRGARITNAQRRNGRQPATSLRW